MAIVSLNTIKNWFKTGLKPTQAQFWDTWDSFRHKSEKVPAADVEGIDALLLAKADKAVLDDHLTNTEAHAPLFLAKEDKNQKGVAGGYVPLDGFIKIASQYLDIVNDLVAGGSTSLLSAEQGKVLKTQIDAINLLLTSDNVNLDTVQELVDAIETVEASLETILVNDLTTGGTTKALTAEMGKQLKVLYDDVSAKIPKDYSKVVYVNSNTPATTTIFDTNNPPVTNDDLLKEDVNNLYIGLDTSSWVYNATTLTYDAETITSKSSTFYLYGTNKDAGNNKNSEIERSGAVGVGTATKPNHAVTKAQLDLKQDIANQIEVTASQDAQVSWHGKTVFFMANVTITIPAIGLPTGYTFEGVTEPSCSVTWAITTPKTWALGAPAATPEKSIFTLMQLMSNSDKIYLFGL